MVVYAITSIAAVYFINLSHACLLSLYVSLKWYVTLNEWSMFNCCNTDNDNSDLIKFCKIVFRFVTVSLYNKFLDI